MLVFGRDREIARWVGMRLDVYDFGPCSAIGVVRDEHLVAGAVYSHYNHPDIKLSFASTTPRWASREAIRAILRYPFVQLNCRRVTCISPESKADAIRFMERLGFVREGRHPHGFIDDTAISLGLLREAAERWL